MRVTANQVTFARLVAMPALAAALYGGKTSLLVAVILGTIVGCTDFVDGYLARKQGPTLLGGLMDPVADKVFIVVTYVPFAERGWIPWVPVALLLCREFVVTGLRSSFEIRQRQLKSTYLAKVKTWVQMCGLGVLALLLIAQPATLVWVFGAAVAAALVAGIAFRLVTGLVWRGSLVFGFAAAVVTTALAVGTARAASVGTIWTIVAITWLSALDYLVAGLRELASRSAGRVRGFDLVRWASAAVLPPLALFTIKAGGAPWILVAVLAIEIAHAGLDNLLAHNGNAAPAHSWGGRMAIVCGAMACAIAFPRGATHLSLIALGASTMGAARAFWGGRRFYLEGRSVFSS